MLMNLAGPHWISRTLARAGHLPPIILLLIQEFISDLSEAGQDGGGLVDVGESHLAWGQILGLTWGSQLWQGVNTKQFTGPHEESTP